MNKKKKKTSKPEVVVVEKPASKMPLVDKKLTDKVTSCQANLEDYMKKNKLDPTKDWSGDKKHGTKIKELVSMLNMARKKVEESAPKEITHKKSEDKKKSTNAKYDYPKVNGREMTSDEKKKYRQKMRTSKDGKVKAEKVGTKAKVETKAKVLEKTTNTKKVTKKPDLKAKAKNKKKRSED